MRPLTVAIAAFGVAACVAAVGAGLDAADVQHGAKAVAMLALAACTALAGRTAPQPLRRALLAFCLLLAASALVDLATDRMSVPAPALEGRNGCPLETDATTDYRRDQLHYGQLAEVLRFLALACAVQAVRILPRSPRPRSRRRLVIIALLLTPPVLIGPFPFFSGSDAPGLLLAVAPGVLTLTAAVALTALTMTRAGGSRTDNALLTVGVILMLLSAGTAVENLARLYWQLPDPEPDAGFIGCFSVATTASTPSVLTAALAIAVAALFLTAPALFTWSALQVRSSEPTPEAAVDEY